MKLMRRLYDWVLSLSYKPYGALALVVLACAESSFFPVPPDVLLMALCLGNPFKAYRFAFLCTIGSVVGGVLGYAIGLGLFELVAEPILNFYGVMDQFETLREMYQKYDAYAVIVAGFTPIPYKVFTIAAGVCHLNLPVFIGASLIGRAGRFYLEAFLLYHYGPTMKGWIERYFGWLSYGFVALVFAGFAAVKFLF